MVDLGEGVRPFLFWVKKEEMMGGRKASRASKSKPPKCVENVFTQAIKHKSDWVILVIGPLNWLSRVINYHIIF